MAGGIVGAEIAQLEGMANTFNSQSGQLQTLTSQLDNITQQSVNFWKGAGADKFRNEWATCKSAFQKMITALDEGSKAAHTYAQNIDAATR